MENVELARKKRQEAEEDAGAGGDMASVDTDTLSYRYQDSKNRFGKNHPDTVRLAHEIATRHAEMADHRRRLIGHLRNKHKRKGEFEAMSTSDLHRHHENDHRFGGVTSHSHEPDIAPRDRGEYADAMFSNTYGDAEHFDAWGQKVDLATKVVDYGNGTRVIHHSAGRETKKAGKSRRPRYAKGNYVGFAGLVKRITAQGKSEEEARAIAAAIGRRKYGAKKFASFSRKRGGE